MFLSCSFWHIFLTRVVFPTPTKVYLFKRFGCFYNFQYYVLLWLFTLASHTHRDLGNIWRDASGMRDPSPWRVDRQFPQVVMTCVVREQQVFKSRCVCDRLLAESICLNFDKWLIFDVLNESKILGGSWTLSQISCYALE